MASRRLKVILCKGVTENEAEKAYVDTFEFAGYECDYLRTLRFEFLNIPELLKCLLVPETYCGLILTSRRAVNAIDLATKADRSFLQPWKNLPAYCVGQATQSFSENHLGLQNCLGSEAGNAKALAERIVLDRCSKSKPLLYPCSEIARETLEEMLTDKGISLQKLVTYRTLACESLESDLLKLTNVVSKIFVFFSPSTVESVVSILKKHVNSVTDIKAVAIGPTTGRALMEHGFKIYAIAEKPEPYAVLQAVSELDIKTL